jgi:hypothetical protein
MLAEGDDRWEMRSETQRRPWREVVTGAAPDRISLDPQWPAGSWEAMFRWYVTEDGNDVEAYTISAVARVLNRRPVTVRRLERLRHLPPAPFRSAPIIDVVTNTVIRSGQRRLYTYEHIVGLQQIWTDAGLDRTVRPIPQAVRVEAFRLYGVLAARSRTSRPM